MTTFRAPFAMTQVQDTPTVAEVTVQETSARGSSTYTRLQRFAATAQFNTDIFVSGRPLTPGGHTLAYVANVTVNAQTATAGFNVTIPTGAHVHDIQYMLLSNQFATAAADLQILIGTTADDNEYATFAASGGTPSIANFTGPVIQNTTVQTQHFTGVCGLALHGIASNIITVKTTAVSGTVSSKDALLSFFYSRTA